MTQQNSEDHESTRQVKHETEVRRRRGLDFDFVLSDFRDFVISVADFDRAAAFYDAVLATLGLRRRKERPGAIGYPSVREIPD